MTKSNKNAKAQKAAKHLAKMAKAQAQKTGPTRKEIVAKAFKAAHTSALAKRDDSPVLVRVDIINLQNILAECTCSDCKPSEEPWVQANPNAQGESVGAQDKKHTTTVHNNHGCYGKNYGVRIDRGNGWEEFANWPMASEATNVAMGSLRWILNNAPTTGKYAGWKVERMN
jgi:hypothetical protein